MTIYANIGAKALYLLFVWLLSAAGAAWLSERKGYTERLGLTFGLVLTFVGFIIVLLLPGRPGSAWREDGPVPKRRRAAGPGPAASVTGPPAIAASDPEPPSTESADSADPPA